MVGSIAPWGRALSVSLSGLEGDGKFTLLLAGLSLLGVLLDSNSSKYHPWVIAAWGAAFLALSAGVYDLLHVQRLTSGSGGVAAVGWGLWLTVLASLSLTAATIILWGREPQTARSRTPSSPGMSPPGVERVEGDRECPSCKEPMRRDASVCPHCMQPSEPWQYHSGVWWAKLDGHYYWLREPPGEWIKHTPPNPGTDEGQHG